MGRQYKTARAFRAALEDRLNHLARTQGLDLTRLRRQVGFERFLARLFDEDDPPWLLKGGYAFELRLLEQARGTKDLDLTIPAPARIAPPDAEQLVAVRERLQAAGERDLGDWFVYRVGASMVDLDGAPSGGMRFPVEARLDNRPFARFHVDVGLGDAVIAAPEWVTGRNVLEFAEIPPARVAILPREQQFAEKVHAYTLPRGERVNNRVKDLVDMALLLELGLPEIEQVRRALHATFARRQTHILPASLVPPPETWREPYAELAAECGVRLTTAEEAFAALAAYWELLWQPSDEPPAEEAAGGESSEAVV